MARPLNLRQIEAFKAVVEAGTVGAAAETLGVTQPAISKLIAHLEADTSLNLFDRVRGRLALTAQGMRLYNEIHRIFAGIDQVQRAVDTIKREERGRLIIGSMPALAEGFVRDVVASFLAKRPDVYVRIMVRSSQYLTEWLVTRQIDVAFLASTIDNPYLTAEQLMHQPIVCLMTENHPLARKRALSIADLDGVGQVGFEVDSTTRRTVDLAFREHGLRPNYIIETTTAPMVCQLVGAGLGVALLHPATVINPLPADFALRPLTPAVPMEFKMCFAREGRPNEAARLFAEHARQVAGKYLRRPLSGAATRSSR